MHISLNWLKEYVEVPNEIEPPEFGLKVTMSTAEIEGYEVTEQDTVYEIDNKSLTHRPDLWGHYGFAREIAAIFKRPLKPLSMAQWQSDKSYNLKVNVEDLALCPRYNALVIAGVEVKESPLWLQERLKAIGSRPINNIVDLTNYVLHEVGQPLHAFDATQLQGQEIQVRLAKTGEVMTTLDGVERELTPNMLVIADQNKPVALAGVMGGANSEVTDTTTTIVLESANFHPTNIRLTSVKLGLRSDASMRFEKGLDPQQTEIAAQRFYTLLKEVCPDCRVVSELYDVARPFDELPVIQTSFEFINRKLGTQLPNEQIVDILTRLFFKVETQGDELRVTVPSFRATGDIGIPEDLVEEVGRIFGYDNITPTSPLVTIQPVRLLPHQLLLRKLRQLLSNDLALTEVFHYSFVGDEILAKTGLSSQNHIALANPLSSEHHLLRQSLVPNLLKITAENLRYKKDFGIYELERVFMNEAQADSNIDHERFALCALLCRSNRAQSEEVFFELKGMLETIVPRLDKGALGFKPTVPQNCPPWAHPGRTATLEVQGQAVGHLAQLHPQVANNFGIKATVALFTLDVTTFLNVQEKKQVFTPISRYPVVPFDISLLCGFKTHIQEVEDAIRSAAPERIKKIELFDVYIPPDQIDHVNNSLLEDLTRTKQKSLAFTITFAAEDHTLSPDEITQLQNGVIAALENQSYIVRKG